MDTVSIFKQRIVPLILQYKVPLVLGGISVICIVVSVFFLILSQPKASPTIFTLGTATESAKDRGRTIRVDIAGAVKNPGVYTLGEGARVEDAIQAAGGLTQTVSTTLLETSVNRAARINDGGKVYIPQLNEETGKTVQNKGTNTKNKDNNTSYNINTNQTGSFISINNASQQDLEALPGVGPVTALKIISSRPYTNLNQLLERQVVGQKLYENIKDQLGL